MLAWRYQESLAASEEALALALRVGAGEAEVRALTVRGVDLAYIGQAEEGVAQLRQALQRAEDIGDYWGLDRVYINFTDTLTMLGRLRESARLGQTGLEAMRRYGVYSPVLVSNLIEALHASGDWDEAERLSAAALRSVTSSFPYSLFIVRALVEIDRGEFDAGRAHFEAADLTLREDRGLGVDDGWLADLALWEHRWTDADAAIEKGLAYARQREAAQIRVQVCAKGLRTQAELAASHAPAETPTRSATGSAARRAARRRASAAARPRRSRPTPPAGSRSPRPSTCAREPRRDRKRGRKRPWPGTSSSARRSPPTAAGGSRSARRRRRVAYRGERAAPGSSRGRNPDRGRAPGARAPAARRARAPRSRVTRSPHLRREVEPRGRPRSDAARSRGTDPRPRGYTNREIAGELVISVKTASVHVSHILRKLDAPNHAKPRPSPTASHPLDIAPP